MKKITAVIVTGVFLLSVLAGCASDSDATGDDSGAINSSFLLKDTEIYGQVASIDGQNLVLNLGNVQSGGMGGDFGGGGPAMPEDGEVPEMPDGDGSGESAGSNNEMPEEEEPEESSGGDAEMPEGEEPGEKPGAGEEMPGSGGMPGGGNMGGFMANGTTATLTIASGAQVEIQGDETSAGSLSDISEGDVLLITFGADGSITNVTITDKQTSDNTPEANASGAGFGGGSMTENSGTGANTFEEDDETEDESYTSEADDENAVRVQNSASVSFNAINISKTGNTSNSEDSDFYGLNAGLLARDGSQVTITNAVVNTDASGGNGVFSYGDGTKVTISDTIIKTNQGNSGGIELAGGGEIEASNLDIETQGSSSAAIRSDRGGGLMTVNGGSYLTNGTGSPAIYSTAEIHVSDSYLSAANSEALVVEGMNFIELNDCDITGNMQGTYGEGTTENLHGVMIYQSMSGDADEGMGSLVINGGSLTNQNGDTFYITNTQASVVLNNVNITNADGNFLTVAGNDGSNGWGSPGINGGQCGFVISNQKIEGVISVDDISTLTLELSENSTFTGAINETGQQGAVHVSLDENSTWELTGDSYITQFTGDTSQIVSNNYHIYVNGEQII